MHVHVVGSTSYIAMSRELASHGPVEAVQKIKAVISASILFERAVRDETTMFVQHACLT